jgi:hypothetical protein
MGGGGGQDEGQNKGLDWEGELDGAGYMGGGGGEYMRGEYMGGGVNIWKLDRWGITDKYMFSAYLSSSSAFIFFLSSCSTCRYKQTTFHHSQLNKSAVWTVNRSTTCCVSQHRMTARCESQHRTTARCVSQHRTTARCVSQHRTTACCASQHRTTARCESQHHA